MSDNTEKVVGYVQKHGPIERAELWAGLPEISHKTIGLALRSGRLNNRIHQVGDGRWAFGEAPKKKRSPKKKTARLVAKAEIDLGNIVLLLAHDGRVTAVLPNGVEVTLGRASGVEGMGVSITF